MGLKLPPRRDSKGNKVGKPTGPSGSTQSAQPKKPLTLPPIGEWGSIKSTFGKYGPSMDISQEAWAQRASQVAQAEKLQLPPGVKGTAYGDVVPLDKYEVPVALQDNWLGLPGNAIKAADQPTPAAGTAEGGGTGGTSFEIPPEAGQPVDMKAWAAQNVGKAGGVGPHGEKLPEGAVGWTARGEPYFGAGAGNWLKYLKWRAGSRDTAESPWLKERKAQFATMEAARTAYEQGGSPETPTSYMGKPITMPVPVEMLAAQGIDYKQWQAMDPNERALKGLGAGIEHAAWYLGTAWGALEYSQYSAAGVAAIPGQIATWIGAFVSGGVQALEEEARGIEKLLAPVASVYGREVLRAGQVTLGRQVLGYKGEIAPQLSIEDAKISAAIGYTAIFDETARQEFVRAVAGGMDPYIARDKFANPMAQLVGDLTLGNLFDPLNWISLGTSLVADVGKVRNLERLINASEDVSNALADLNKATDAASAIAARVRLAGLLTKEAGEQGKKYEALREARRFWNMTADGKRGMYLEVTTNFVMRVIATTRKADGSVDMEKAMETLHALAMIHSGDEADAMHAAAMLEKDLAAGTYWGEQGRMASKVLYDSMFGPDPTRKAGWFIKAIEDAQGDPTKLIERLAPVLEKSVDDMFPSVSNTNELIAKAVAQAKKAGLTDNIYAGLDDAEIAAKMGVPVPPKYLRITAQVNDAIREGIYNPVNRILGTIYMGMSPAYALRNAMSNYMHILIDYGPGALRHMPDDWMVKTDRWLGYLPYTTQVAFGGPAGLAAGNYWETGGRLMKTLNYFARKSQQAEGAAAKRVVGHVVDRAMRNVVKAIGNDKELAAILGPDLGGTFGKHLTRMLMEKYGNTAEVADWMRKAVADGNIEAWRGLLALDDKQFEMLRQLSTVGADEELIRALNTATDPKDFSKAISGLKDKLRHVAAQAALDYTKFSVDDVGAPGEQVVMLRQAVDEGVMSNTAAVLHAARIEAGRQATDAWSHAHFEIVQKLQTRMTEGLLKLGYTTAQIDTLTKDLFGIKTGTLDAMVQAARAEQDLRTKQVWTAYEALKEAHPSQYYDILKAAGWVPNPQAKLNTYRHAANTLWEWWSTTQRTEWAKHYIDAGARVTEDLGGASGRLLDAIQKNPGMLPGEGAPPGAIQELLSNMDSVVDTSMKMELARRATETATRWQSVTPNMIWALGGAYAQWPGAKHVLDVFTELHLPTMLEDGTPFSLQGLSAWLRKGADLLVANNPEKYDKQKLYELFRADRMAKSFEWTQDQLKLAGEALSEWTKNRLPEGYQLQVVTRADRAQEVRVLVPTESEFAGKMDVVLEGAKIRYTPASGTLPPVLDVIEVEEGSQKKYQATKLFLSWLQNMVHQGQQTFLTTAQTEDGQAFFKRMVEHGYIGLVSPEDPNLPNAAVRAADNVKYTIRTNVLGILPGLTKDETSMTPLMWQALESGTDWIEARPDEAWKYMFRFAEAGLPGIWKGADEFAEWARETLLSKGLVTKEGFNTLWMSVNKGKALDPAEANTWKLLRDNIEDAEVKNALVSSLNDMLKQGTDGVDATSFYEQTALRGFFNKATGQWAFTTSKKAFEAEVRKAGNNVIATVVRGLRGSDVNLIDGVHEAPAANGGAKLIVHSPWADDAEEAIKSLVDGGVNVRSNGILVQTEQTGLSWVRLSDFASDYMPDWFNSHTYISQFRTRSPGDFIQNALRDTLPNASRAKVLEVAQNTFVQSVLRLTRIKQGSKDWNEMLAAINKLEEHQLDWLAKRLRKAVNDQESLTSADVAKMIKTDAKSQAGLTVDELDDGIAEILRRNGITSNEEMVAIFGNPDVKTGEQWWQGVLRTHPSNALSRQRVLDIMQEGDRQGLFRDMIANKKAETVTEEITDPALRLRAQLFGAAPAPKAVRTEAEMAAEVGEEGLTAKAQPVKTKYITRDELYDWLKQEFGFDAADDPLKPALAKEVAPTWAQSVEGNLSGYMTLLDDIEATVTKKWGQKLDIPSAPDAIKNIDKWQAEATRMMERGKAMAAEEATQARKFTLLDYRQKYGFDLALAYIYPYQFWYGRTYRNWLTRIARKPYLLKSYAAYRMHNEKIHAGQPDWWKNNIQIPNWLPGVEMENPLFFNLEATINPLYGLLGPDFNNSQLKQYPATKLISDLGKFGPTVWTPFVLGAAFWLKYVKKEKDPDTAAALAGRLLPQSALYHTIAGSIKNLPEWIPKEIDPAVLAFAGGTEYFERGRIGRELFAMAERGDITGAQAMDAARDQKGDVWMKAQMNVLRQRLPGVAAGAAAGVGFKSRTQQDMMIDEFYGYRNSLLGQADSMSPDEYAMAWENLRRAFPFSDALMMAKQPSAARDRTLSYNVLGRIPPGTAKFFQEWAKLPPEMVDQFYESKGQVLYGSNPVDPSAKWKPWKEADIARWNAAILDMAAVLEMPSDATQVQWNAVRGANRSLDVMMVQRYGEDIEKKMDTFYGFLAEDEQQAYDYLDHTTGLDEAMKWKQQYILNHPMLNEYYGGPDAMEKYFKSLMYSDAKALFGPDIFTLQSVWGDIKDSGGNASAFLKDTSPEFGNHKRLTDYWKWREGQLLLIDQRMTEFGGRLDALAEANLRKDIAEDTWGTLAVLSGFYEAAAAAADPEDEATAAMVQKYVIDEAGDKVKVPLTGEFYANQPYPYVARFLPSSTRYSLERYWKSGEPLSPDTRTALREVWEGLGKPTGEFNGWITKTLKEQWMAQPVPEGQVVPTPLGTSVGVPPGYAESIQQLIGY